MFEPLILSISKAEESGGLQVVGMALLLCSTEQQCTQMECMISQRCLIRSDAHLRPDFQR